MDFSLLFFFILPNGQRTVTCVCSHVHSPQQRRIPLPFFLSLRQEWLCAICLGTCASFFSTPRDQYSIYSFNCVPWACSNIVSNQSLRSPTMAHSNVSHRLLDEDDTLPLLLYVNLVYSRLFNALFRRHVTTSLQRYPLYSHNPHS